MEHFLLSRSDSNADNFLEDREKHGVRRSHGERLGGRNVQSSFRLDRTIPEILCEIVVLPISGCKECVARRFNLLPRLIVLGIVFGKPQGGCGSDLWGGC